ncbi:transposase [Flavobacteriaceae bacterium]|nr:transposase [Flavobacteriaceae bacterium]
MPKIRNCFGIDNDTQLSNEIEIDETYVGGKNNNRHATKKFKNSQSTTTIDKSIQFFMVKAWTAILKKI